MRNIKRPRLLPVAVVPVAVAAALGIAACASSGTASSGGGATGGTSAGPATVALGTDAQSSTLNPGSGSLVFDVFAPFSGPDAAFGAHAIPGAMTGAQMINQLGGVLGHKFVITHTDSRGDPADAVPALQQAIATTGNLTAALGPTSDEALATLPILRRQGIPTFDQAGDIQLDGLQSKWVYRILSSDSQDAVAMAYQAAKIDKAKRVALVFASDAGSQSLVPPLESVLKKMGVQVTANISLTPDQPSYRTEALRVSQSNAQAILTETDDATAATFWSQLDQNGGINIPIIGSGPTTGQDYFQAVQKAMSSATSAFTKEFSGVQFSTAGTCATPTFIKYFHELYPTQQPLLGHVNYYDTLTLIALAMLKANSVQPDKWVPEVKAITNATNATPVCTFAQGKALIAQGKAITYVGTKGSMAMNSSNTVTVSEEAITFDNSGNTVVRNQLPESELQPFNTGL
jgi:ABC-type branched-subunit amino acid transport system substrate-binding protein